MSRRLALLISNSEYNDTRLTNLAAPLGDAEAFAIVLSDPQIGAFDQVDLILNQSASDVRYAISEFFVDKQITDLLLLYFSGHGLLDERSRLYLAATDTNVKLPRARSVEAAYIAQEMDDCHSKRQILILDCCHSGAFRQGITKSTVGQPVQTGTIFDGDGRVVLAASDATQYAFEGDSLIGESARSLFTRYLVEGLATFAADYDGDGAITIDDLYLYAHDHVAADKPTQTPVKWNYRQRGAFVIAGQIRSAAERTSTVPANSSTINQPKPPIYRTWIVDQMHRGDFTTIGEAIAAAKAGDKIVIRPGVYDEGLVIDKPLEIEGEGDAKAVIVQAVGKNTILFKSTVGQLRNLTLRQSGGGDWCCIDISQGRLLLEGCDISSRGADGIAIHNSATPTVRNNHIHDGKSSGIYVYAHGQGVIEENDIFANSHHGITIMSGGNPTVRNNRIYSGTQIGIFVTAQGQGLIEGNDIFANAFMGIGISSGGSPTVRSNRIYNGKSSGIFIDNQGQGVIEKNDIFANALSGIGIKNGSNPTIRNNCIHDGKGIGIDVFEQGQGVIEENDIFANALSGIAISQRGNPTVRNNRIHDSKENGICIYMQGKGVIEGNEIFANARAGILTMSGGNPTVHNNRIYENSYEAIWVYKQGCGHFEKNDLRNNKRGAWDIAEDCLPNVIRKDNIEA